MVSKYHDPNVYSINPSGKRSYAYGQLMAVIHSQSKTQVKTIPQDSHPKEDGDLKPASLGTQMVVM